MSKIIKVVSYRIPCSKKGCKEFYEDGHGFSVWLSRKDAQECKNLDYGDDEWYCNDHHPDSGREI